MFETIDKKSIVESIRDQIRSLILQEQLKPGSKLPPEKKLIQQLGVSRPALREAIHLMVGEGLLEVHSGRGTYVREPTSATAIQADVVSLLLMPEDLQEIQEVRQILEPEIAARVAERATEKELNDLEHILEDMARAVDAGHSTFELAWRFHRRLPKAAGNAAMAKIIDIIYEMIKRGERTLYDQYFDPQQELLDHRALVEVLRTRDPEKARAAMQAHLKVVNENLSTAFLTQQGAHENPPSRSPD